MQNVTLVCSYNHTLPRELEEVAVLSYLVGNVEDHAVHVGCHVLFLKPFKFPLLAKIEEVFQPLFPLENISLLTLYRPRMRVIARTA